MAKGEKVSLVAVPDMLPMATAVCRIMRANNFKVRDVIPVELKSFADGVTLAQITQSIRRTEVYLFYTAPIGRPDLGFAELGKILNAAHFGSPRSIKVVLPHLWEGRSDRKSEARSSTNVKELARTIERRASVDGLFTFDLHAEQIILAFDRVPVDDLKGRVLLANYCKTQCAKDGSQNYGIVAPDSGSMTRAEKFAKRSGIPFKGLIYKERTGANVTEAKRYIGEPLSGIHVILPDDIIDTAGTILGAGGKVMGEGALSVTAVTTHWLGSPKEVPGEPALRSAEAKFRQAGITVIATNTIPRKADYRIANEDFLTVIDCEEMLAGAIMESLTPGGSVSKLSEEKKV